MFGRRKKCALLIDFDNVLGMTSGDFTTSITRWMEWLEDGAFDEKRRKRNFLVKRVYWNPLYERYRDAFEAAGFEAFACGAIAKSKKSSADMVITLDAVDIAAETKGLQEIILLTSDTDFVPVVNRLQDRDLEVVAMGHEQNPTAAVYREYADHVVLRNAFIDAFKYERPKRKWFGLVRVKPPAPKVVVTAARQLNPGATPLEQAAERIVQAAEGVGGAMLSRKAVIFSLRDVPGFNTGGTGAWLGYGSYRKMLQAIAKKRRELRIYAYRNGGVAVAYRPPEAASRNASAG
ncbi:MAG: NYN domain-containing protein [Hyphomonadaceae bacterium]